jgi:hypothetical protein
MGDVQRAVHPCKHCNGTTFCSATRDATGKLKTRPACVGCLVKAGLNPKAIYDKVICSVCRGTGLVELTREAPRAPRPFSWYWLIITPLLVISLAALLSSAFYSYREEHKYDNGQDILRQRDEEAIRSTAGLPLSAIRTIVHQGMTKDAVSRELGDPMHITGQGFSEVWNYRCKDGTLTITFANDVVREVR